MPIYVQNVSSPYHAQTHAPTPFHPDAHTPFHAYAPATPLAPSNSTFKDISVFSLFDP